MNIGFSVEMSVDPRDALASLIASVERAVKSVPVGIWDNVEQKIMELQLERWTDIMQLGISTSTLRKKYYLLGRPIEVGAGGHTEEGAFVDDFGVRTGFLADIMMGQRNEPGFSLPRIESGDGVAGGTYVFGIDPTKFFQSYPLYLIKAIGGQIPGETKILVDNPESLEMLAMFVWDNMFQIITEVLESEGFSG